MKKLVIFLLLINVAVASYAQVRLSPGLILSSPSSSTYSFALGTGMGVNYIINKKVSFGIYGSYEHFFNANGWEDKWMEDWGYEYRDNNRNVSQFRVNFHYYFGDKLVRPYVGCDLGVTKQYIYYEYKDSYYGWLHVDNTETSLGFSPILGLEISLSDRIFFDTLLKYNGFDVSYLSCKIGLSFIFGTLDD